jgi:hypothetical protein
MNPVEGFSDEPFKYKILAYRVIFDLFNGGITYELDNRTDILGIDDRYSWYV